MAETLNYPHIDLENAPFAQFNSTTSSNMQTQFNNDHRGGAWIRDASTTTRSAVVHFHSGTQDYRVIKKSDNGAVIVITQADFATLSAAADDAAAFVDSENTPS